MSGAEFEKVVADYYRPLYRFAFCLTGSEGDASELTRQVFYLWAVKRAQARARLQVKTWLFASLHRAFLGMPRAQKHPPQTELPGLGVNFPVIAPEAARHLDIPQTVAALARIDESQRAPVALFYLEDWTREEMAEILDAPVGAFNRRLARGLAQLRLNFSDRSAESRPLGGPA